MSERDYSLTGLNNFLDYALDKGLMKKETASGRKRASNQILEVLDEHELRDLRQVDLDAAARRFANLQGSKFKPSSLQVYVSRTKSAVQDFISYVDDPINFRSSVSTRASSGNGKFKKDIKKQKDIGSSTNANQAAPPLSGDTSRQNENPGGLGGAPGTLIFPVPIRSNLVVNISNIPSDLTEQEAAKIAAVIKALAIPSG